MNRGGEERERRPSRSPRRRVADGKPCSSPRSPEAAAPPCSSWRPARPYHSRAWSRTGWRASWRSGRRRRRREEASRKSPARRLRSAAVRRERGSAGRARRPGPGVLRRGDGDEEGVPRAGGGFGHVRGFTEAVLVAARRRVYAGDDDAMRLATRFAIATPPGGMCIRGIRIVRGLRSTRGAEEEASRSGIDKRHPEDFVDVQPQCVPNKIKTEPALGFYGSDGLLRVEEDVPEPSREVRLLPGSSGASFDFFLPPADPPTTAAALLDTSMLDTESLRANSR